MTHKETPECPGAEARSASTQTRRTPVDVASPAAPGSDAPNTPGPERPGKRITEIWVKSPGFSFGSHRQMTSGEAEVITRSWYDHCSCGAISAGGLVEIEAVKPHRPECTLLTMAQEWADRR